MVRCYGTLLVSFLTGSSKQDVSSDDGVDEGQLVPQKRQLSSVTLEDGHKSRTAGSIDYSWLTDCFKPL